MKCILVKGVQFIGYTSSGEVEKANCTHTMAAQFYHYLFCLIPNALACVTNGIRIVLNLNGFSKSPFFQCKSSFRLLLVGQSDFRFCLTRLLILDVAFNTFLNCCPLHRLTTMRFILSFVFPCRLHLAVVFLRSFSDCFCTFFIPCCWVLQPPPSNKFAFCVQVALMFACSFGCVIFYFCKSAHESTRTTERMSLVCFIFLSTSHAHKKKPTPPLVLPVHL